MLGAGTLAVSAAAALGTGAFSAAQVSGRDVDIAVVNDADALVGLVPNPEVGGVHDDDGELVIDLGTTGINQNSVYQFGLFVDDDSGDAIAGLTPFPKKSNEPSSVGDQSGEFDSAFLITNQTNNTYDLTIEYRLEEEDVGESGEFNTEFWFEVHNDGEQLDQIHGPTPDPVAEEITLGSGETIGVSFLLHAPDETLGERIDGDLAVDAVVSE
ncbi:hypothetical protein [Halorubrum tibetense]|uniref:DUF1102 domain-containing protein n=1 Tax=Halorubrum tibetense TaxID=175631 RepID=A0ABD5SEW5_9EURY